MTNENRPRSCGRLLKDLIYRATNSAVRLLYYRKYRRTDDEEALPTYLSSLFPSLEMLNLAHNEFVESLPPLIVNFSHLRRIQTHGNSLTARSNAKEVAQLISDRSPRTDNDDDEKRVENLSKTCIKILRSEIRSNPSIESEIISYLPLHLSTQLINSYTCTSCKKLIISIDEKNYLPKLFEMVHHLSPGLTLPSSPSIVASQGMRMTGIDVAKRYLSIDEKVLIGLLGSDLSLNSLIIGTPTSSTFAMMPEGEGYQFCFECAGFHLGVREGACDCWLCTRERQVYSIPGHTLRWLRRKGTRIL